MKKNRMNWNYLLIAPSLLISFSVILIPGILTIVTSLTDWNGISPKINFIGIRNFLELFSDKVFFIAIRNNVTWALLFLTIPVCIGMLVAMFLLGRKKTRSIYQIAFIIPYVLSPIANAMIWENMIFSPLFGLVGYLRNLGIDISSPLASMQSAIYACAGVDIWHYWSYLTIIYLAALRQTPTEQLESARLDGCNGWQLFRYIYFPSIRATVNLMFVMIVIGSFLSFDYVKLLTGGGPAHSSEVLGTYAYSLAFDSMKVGKAAAAGLVMSFFGLIASIFYARLSRKETME